MKTRFLLILLATLLPLSQSGCKKAPKQRELVILAVNDMHATIGNFPRFAFIVDSLRTIYPDMLLVSAGDNQTGNPVNDQHNLKGRPMIELMNTLHFDVTAVGNHEFDTKPEGFSANRQTAQFDYICSNLTQPDDESTRIKPYKIVALPNGLRVVFASLLHINEGGIPDSHPDNVKGFTFTSPLETAQTLLHLRDSGDVFIMLNHLGFENDVALAQTLPSNTVDLIIGGHSHTRVDKEQIHNGIMITQAENKLKYATLIHIKVKPDGQKERTMQLLPVGKEGNEREDIRAKVEEYSNNPALREKIAEATEELTSYDEVGYMMVDALRAETNVDIALWNAGGVRIDHLSKGDVSVMDVYTMDPFGNDVILFKLTGHEIRALMLSAFEIDERKPIYPSGIHTRYILEADGSLKDVQLLSTDGKGLNMDKVYTVAMNNYMASIYKYEHKDLGTSLFRTSAEHIISQLRKQGQIPSYKNVERVFTSK